MDKSNQIFGIHPVIEAIESGKTIDKLFIQKGLQGENFTKVRQLIKEYKVPHQYVPIEKLNRLTRKNHQGLFGFLSPIDFHTIEGFLPQIYEDGKNPFLLILDRISDVRNFGAIARTAECVGVQAIIIPEKGAAAVNADAIKTSAGALFNIPVCKESSLKKAVEFLQLSGVQVVSATEKATQFIFDLNFTVPTAIIMGNEETGVSNDLLTKCDAMAKLPMDGKTQSLNVSVACGAMLYEVVRQRI